jgi:LysR family transcriptional regulator for bpeEF and oprC
MDRLLAMKVFTVVAETGSFSRAADVLEMPRASTTVIIQRLETYLKVRLLHRTTRRLSLTSDGAAYYERCVRILADIDDAEGGFDALADGPRGKLRVDMPVSLGRRIVIPELNKFHERYPNINLMLSFNDKAIDLILESTDCALRVGVLEDSTLIARNIGTYEIVTVASPAYLNHNGIPKSIDDLQRHLSVNYFWTRTSRVMTLNFNIDGRVEAVRMRSYMAVNDTEVLIERCLDGVGLIQAPLFLARPYLESGELIEILPQLRAPSYPISVVYPGTRHLSLAVRVFADWLAEVFEKSPLL